MTALAESALVRFGTLGRPRKWHVALKGGGTACGADGGGLSSVYVDPSSRHPIADNRICSLCRKRAA